MLGDLLEVVEEEEVLQIQAAAEEGEAEEEPA